MRIAVVSTDGTNVEEHFGRATRFFVYDRVGDGLCFVAERPVSPLSSGGPSHRFDPGRFAAVAEVLEDCQRVYCTRIGDTPAAELTRRGVAAVRYGGPIEQIAAKPEE